VFWRDIHAVTGVWVSLMALTLLLSGLPWSKSWGGMLEALRHTYAQTMVAQDWTTGSEAEQRTNQAANTPAGGEHAHMAGMGQMTGGGMVDPDAYTPLDRLVPAVSKFGWPAPVLISPPSQLSPGWSARTETQNRPQRVEVRLDPATGAVLSQVRFADRPFLDRLIGYGVAIHEGQLFAPLNQVLGVFTALGLLTMAVSSVVLWWRRRPAGTLGAPPAHAAARYPAAIIALVCVLGVLLPLLGATLVLVLILEWGVLRRFPGAQHILGLTARSVEEPNLRRPR